MLLIYNTSLRLLRPVARTWGLWSGRDPRRRREWSERCARELPRARPGGIWIHGSSLGEARLVSGVARALRRAEPELPICVSAMTRAGRDALPAPPLVDAAFYVPLDFPGWPARVFEALRPRALCLVETELWPNLLHSASAQGVPTLLLNGRLSAKGWTRYRLLRSIFRPLVGSLARVGARSALDASRFLELGARPETVVVTGDLKFDIEPPEIEAGWASARLGVGPGRRVLLAGSIAEGEEVVLLDAFAQLLKDPAQTTLVLAPRHLDRADEVGRAITASGLTFRRLSDLPAPESIPNVVLVDTHGELARLYAAADVAFVGGTLVPRGGHNLLEPAALGVPVLFGPHTENVDLSATALLAAGAAIRVDGAASIVAAVRRIFADAAVRSTMGSAAKSVVDRHRGALARSVELVLECAGVGATPADVRR